jgi:hypothetical protein
MVAINIFFTEVIQESSPLPHQLKQSSLGTKIMFVGDHMSGQLAYSFGQNRYLNLRRARIFLINPEVSNDIGLPGFNQFNLSLTLCGSI